MSVCILVFVICRENHLFSAPYFIVNCGLSGSTQFFHIISQSERILEKKLLNIKKNVCFEFLYKFCLKHFSF